MLCHGEVLGPFITEAWSPAPRPPEVTHILPICSQGPSIVVLWCLLGSSWLPFHHSHSSWWTACVLCFAGYRLFVLTLWVLELGIQITSPSMLWLWGHEYNSCDEEDCSHIKLMCFFNLSLLLIVFCHTTSQYGSREGRANPTLGRRECGPM